ncbi:MAG: ATP-binding protein [Bacilli bacterium]
MKKLLDDFDFDKVSSDLIAKFKTKMLDKDFLKYVNELDHSDSYLFINEIENSILERRNCIDCKGLSECNNLVKGHKYFVKNVNNKIIEYYKTCEFSKKKEYLQNISTYNSIKSVNFDIKEHNFYHAKERDEIMKYMSTILNNDLLINKGIYLSGSFGVGKSYIMSLFVKSLAKKGYKCAYIYVPQLLVELKTEFNSNSQSILDDIKRKEVLILDDIGAEKVSEWSRDEILGTILQYRMDNKLFTCFSSNYSICNLLEHYNNDKKLVNSRRIVDRIEYLSKEFKLVGENYRK